MGEGGGRFLRFAVFELDLCTVLKGNVLLRIEAAFYGSFSLVTDAFPLCISIESLIVVEEN